MYCIKCGVKLENSEKKCPLCNTEVCHPDFTEFAEPLYPKNKHPKGSVSSKFINGAVIFLFLIPLNVCFFADWVRDFSLNWFGFAAGAIMLIYEIFALPLWFKRPNPVIFVPCGFAAATLYVGYINYALDANWFWSFALPLCAILCIIVSAVTVLLFYLRRGKLFILGGMFLAFGVASIITELLIVKTFSISFAGWSIFPLVVLALLGGLLIYLGINDNAREVLERKFFI